MEVGSAGGALQACRRGGNGGMEFWRSVVGVGTWRHEGLEARCRRSDTEIWRRYHALTRESLKNEGLGIFVKI